MLEKERKERVPGCTNRVYKSSNTIINISCNNDNVIITISGDIENPGGIVITVYLGIFRDIQQYSTIFRNIERYQDILRRLQALSRHMKPKSDIFGILCNPCVYNRAMFKTLAYLEPQASSKAC